MSRIVIEVRYTQVGDASPHQRAIRVEQEIPATAPGPYTDQILALPGLGARSETITIRLPHPVAVAEDITQEEIMLGLVGEALQQERAERLGAAAQREAEQFAEAQERSEWAQDLLAWARSGLPATDQLKGIGYGKFVYGDFSGLPNKSGLAEILGEEAAAEVSAAVKDEHDRRQRAQEARDAECRAKAEAAEAEKAATKERRHAEISAWAKVHGSKHLQDLLALGRDGWPLYLHERLARDFPGAELDNDGTDSDCLTPSAEALATSWEVAARMVEIGVAVTEETALLDLLDVKILKLDGERMEVVFWDDYRPGSDPSWAAKTIRWVVEETRRPIDRDDDEDEGY